jgi:hypothetical protein
MTWVKCPSSRQLFPGAWCAPPRRTTPKDTRRTGWVHSTLRPSPRAETFIPAGLAHAFPCFCRVPNLGQLGQSFAGGCFMQHVNGTCFARADIANISCWARFRSGVPLEQFV